MTSIAPYLEISQRQTLTMTQKLKQAINMLAMNNIELSEMINSEIDNNPLLERESFEEKIDSDKSNNFNESDLNFDENAKRSETDNFNEPDLDIDIDNQFNNGHDDYEYRALNHRNDFTTSDFDMDDLENKTEESLFAHLEKQINSVMDNQTDKITAISLLMYLEPSGYFSTDFSVKNFAKKIGINETKVCSVINKLQNLSPIGCFTQNLKETLYVQLKSMNKIDPMMENLLNNLDLFLKKDMQEMKKRIHASEEDIISMLADIKLCNPKPGAEYLSADNFHVIPDIIVKENKGGDYRVELNQNTLIKPLINREYIATLKSTNPKDKKLNRFINENESSATWLIKSINQRNVNILKVASEIVSRQIDFFHYGVDRLKPLNLNDIAIEVGLDESTVSRITSNKYMATPRGIFDLKYFFPSKLASEHSSSAVKYRIKQLIEEETATTVLSDDEISLFLKKEGINVARRTVLKYRESMGIKPSNIRKREKRLGKI